MTKPYSKMSVAEKAAYARGTMREPSIPCPSCETQTTVADLLDHLQHRCQGRRDPHPSSQWLTWTEALALGVPQATLVRWVRQGVVRWTGEPWRRRYLRRDVVARVAARHVPRLKRFTDGTSGEGGS